MPYLLDSNVFIQAKNCYYGFDFCPAFWDWLVRNKRLVFSIKEVLEEIKTGEDELKLWIEENLDRDFFIGAEVGKDFQNICASVNSNEQYTPEAKDKFLGKISSKSDYADPHLIATAKAKDYILVSHEKCSPEARKKVPIPNVCEQFDVECIDTFEMLRREKARFVLNM